MNSEPTPELLHLTYRQDLAILIGRWGYQPDLPELPAAYEHLRAAALAHQSRRWLQDIRRRTHNDQAITHWLFTEYFPAMAQQLGGQLRVAYLVSPTLRNLIEAAPDFQPLAAYVVRPFAVGFFGEEGAAIAWLHEAERPAN